MIKGDRRTIDRFWKVSKPSYFTKVPKKTFLRIFWFFGTIQTTSCEISKRTERKVLFLHTIMLSTVFRNHWASMASSRYALSQLIHNSPANLLWSQQHGAQRLPVSLHPVVKWQLLYQIRTYLRWRTLQLHFIQTTLWQNWGRTKMKFLGQVASNVPSPAVIKLEFKVAVFIILLSTKI